MSEVTRSRQERFAAPQIAPTRELGAIVLVASVGLLLMVPLVVQALVSFVLGAGFAWPHHHLLAAFVGLAHGRFGVGLTAAGRTLPTDHVMWALICTAETTVLGVVLALAARGRHLLPGHRDHRHGLGGPHQASQALGLSRLKASAAIVRPDLYSRRRRRGPAHAPRRRPRPGAGAVAWAMTLGVSGNGRGTSAAASHQDSGRRDV